MKKQQINFKKIKWKIAKLGGKKLHSNVSIILRWIRFSWASGHQYSREPIKGGFCPIASVSKS